MNGFLRSLDGIADTLFSSALSFLDKRKKNIEIVSNALYECYQAMYKKEKALYDSKSKLESYMFKLKNNPDEEGLWRKAYDEADAQLDKVVDALETVKSDFQKYDEYNREVKEQKNAVSEAINSVNIEKKYFISQINEVRNGVQEKISILTNDCYSIPPLSSMDKSGGEVDLDALGDFISSLKKISTELEFNYNANINRLLKMENLDLWNDDLERKLAEKFRENLSIVEKTKNDLQRLISSLNQMHADLKKYSEV